MRTYDPKKKNWKQPLSEQIKIIEKDISDAEKFLQLAKQYLEKIKRNKDSEPYCYVNKYFMYKMNNGKTLFYKVLRVHAGGVVTERNPVFYRVGEETAGTNFFYQGKISLSVVRKSEEISKKKYDKYVTYAFETGW